MEDPQESDDAAPPSAIAHFAPVVYGMLLKRLRESQGAHPLLEPGVSDATGTL